MAFLSEKRLGESGFNGTRESVQKKPPKKVFSTILFVELFLFFSNLKI